MATELAKAYVQIVPSAEGIKGKLTSVMGKEGDEAGRKGGENAGHSFGSAIKKIIVAAGIGSVIKSALTQGADYEQLVGGIETMFEDLAWDVEQNASKAFKTAGLSANEYMETVMGFSAALNASLTRTEGNIARSADLSDQIIIDMADNANKMGSSMESIQNAYSGFAKQNYTMLDNLKLGYGGTKQEMERLLADATKLSGIEYNIENFSDVAEAIHVVQTEMGITGTTAEEAASTVSGSLASMKSSWSNLLTAMTTGENIDGVIQAFVDSVMTLGDNVLPMLTTVLTNLVPAVGQILMSLAPVLVTDVLPVVLDVLTQLATQLASLLPVILPVIIQTAVDLINALAQALPEILPTLIPVVIQGLVDIGLALIQNLPLLIASIMECMLVIGQTLWGMLSDLWTNTIGPWLGDVLSGIGEWFSGIWSSIGQWFSNIIQKVVTFFLNIWQKYNEIRTNIITAVSQFFSNIRQSIVQWFSNIIQKVVSFVTSIPQKIRDGFSAVTQAGLDLVKGLWNGISNATQWVLEKIRGFGQSILNGIKRIFGIGSPSKEMAYFGEMLDAGLAQGIEDNTRPISNAIDDITTMTTRGFSGTLGVQSSLSVDHTSTGMEQLIRMVAVLADKVDHLQVWLDGDTLVGGISERMDGALGVANTRKARGLA